MNFTEAIRIFDSWGIIDVLVPFILIFTIIYAILVKSEILGHNKKNFNVMVAFSMGFIVVVSHVLNWFPGQADPVNIINSAIPSISLLIVGIVMFLLVIGILGGRASWMGGSLSGWVAIISAVLVIAIFGRAAGWWGSGSLPNWLGWLDNSETQALILIILVFGVVMWFITKEDNEEGESFKLFSDLGDFFKGKE